MNHSHLHRPLLLADLAGRWAILALAAWRLGKPDLEGSWLWVGAAYLAIAIGSTAGLAPLIFGAPPAGLTRALQWALRGLFVADACFVAWVIAQDGGLGSPLYPLFFLAALKAAAAAPWLGDLMVWAFGLGPLYAAALWLTTGNLAFLADSSFLARYLLLWAGLIGAGLLGAALRRGTTQAAALEAALNQQQAILAQKTEILQRTATDLGDRVLELRALQEVARALASTLSLEETLRLVVGRLRDVTGSSHAAVALLDGTAFSPDGAAVLSGILATGERGELADFRLPLAGELLVAEALRSGRVVHSGPETADSLLHRLLGGLPYTVTPLVSRGRSIGVLCLAGGRLAQADVKTEQLVGSLAYFAATAIENARLYEDAWEKRRELEAIMAGIGDGVVVVDPALQPILMNPVAERILGLARPREGEEGTSGGPYPALDRAEAAATQTFAQLLEETLHDQRERSAEIELPAGEGSMRTYGALASPVLDSEGEVSGAVAVLRDITAQKELERMKSNFLSVVSHELRTPLHSIKGFVEIILMGKTGPVTELQEDFLRTVRTQTTALQRMIDDLLEFSRMEAGRVRLHVAEVSLPAVLRNVANKLAPLAEEAGLELYLDLPAELPEIEGDRMRLEQVFTNLVENAIKFTPSGGRVVVSGESLADRVRLTVADTGIGVPPEEQERIFDRFYQVDGSERRAYRGAGLGLSICRHIVERHQGRIWAESEGIPGRGSRFHVELPLRLALSEAPTIDFTTPTAR